MCSAHGQVCKVNPVNRVGYVSTVHKYSSVNGLYLSELGKGGTKVKAAAQANEGT